MTTRRAFLGAAAAGGAAALLGPISALVGCDRTEPFARLSAAEARTMRAFAAQILPSAPGLPGAEDAGAVYFVDRAFGDPFFADTVPVVRAGLAELDARGFASLGDAAQQKMMRSVEKEPYFAAARTLVLIGTFGDPSHGGNRDGVGMRIMRMDHRPTYSAPYGWYDART